MAFKVRKSTCWTDTAVQQSHGVNWLNDLPCRNMIQKTRDAPFQSLSLLLKIWQTMNKHTHDSSRSCHQGCLTCPLSVTQIIFQQQQTRMNVTWVIWLFPVSVFPAKYPISFSSLCRYASGIIWLFLWSICHILTTDLKLQSRLVDRLQRPRLRSSPRRWVCRRRRRWTWPRSPGAGCRRGCWPGRASGLEPWYKILQSVHYW